MNDQPVRIELGNQRQATDLAALVENELVLTRRQAHEQQRLARLNPDDHAIALAFERTVGRLARLELTAVSIQRARTEAAEEVRAA